MISIPFKVYNNTRVLIEISAYESRLLRDHNRFTTAIVTSNSFVSPRVSSSIAIIIRGAARKSMMGGREERRSEGNQVAAVRPLAWCSTGERTMGCGRGGRDGMGDRANCFNKAAAERRTVVESGNWLGSSRTGGTAREGNIQIPSLLAQRIANARRNRAEYYYSTILASSAHRSIVSFVGVKFRRWLDRDYRFTGIIIFSFSSSLARLSCAEYI